MKTSLTDMFDIKVDFDGFKDITDYDAFKDKELLDKLRVEIIARIVNKDLLIDKISSDVINEEINIVVDGLNLSNYERLHLYNVIESEVLGFGPLSELLQDDSVLEIMVNSPKDIYVSSDGEIKKDASVSFINEEHIVRIIKRMIEPMGLSINLGSPMIDTVLSDGSRLRAMIPPVSKSAILSIRKVNNSSKTIDELIGNGSLTPYMARYLEAAVKAKLNIIVNGVSNSGKSNLLRVLCSFIDNDERIITLEEASELKLDKSHVISLLYNKDSNYKYNDILSQALKMNPERLVLGEINLNNNVNFLSIINSGMQGILGTMVALSPNDVMNRLYYLVEKHGDLKNYDLIKELVSETVDLFVTVEKLSDGKRRVTKISELVKLDNGNYEVREIFSYLVIDNSMRGIDGEFRLNPGIPKSYEKMKLRGVKDLEDIFN